MGELSRGKLYTFKLDNSEVFKITIPEFPSTDLGSRIWLSAPVLCKHLLSERNKLQGRRVLELGCGIALPGMLASKLGAKVTLSDGSSPHWRDRVRRCLRANNITNVDLITIDWGCIDHALIDLPPPDIIIASDCFYHSLCHEALISTLSYILRKKPHSLFWFSHQNRSAGSSIEDLLTKWKLQCNQLTSPPHHPPYLTSHSTLSVRRVHLKIDDDDDNNNVNVDNGDSNNDENEYFHAICENGDLKTGDDDDDDDMQGIDIFEMSLKKNF